MMKRRVTMGLLVLAVLGMLTVVAFAEAIEGKETPPPQKCGRNGPGGPGQRWGKAADAGEKFDAMIKSLNLAPETEAAVRKIFETHRNERAEWRREHGKQFEKLQMRHHKARGVSESEGERAQKISEKIEKMRAAQKESREQLMTQLKGHLNEEQMAKVKEFFAKSPERRPGAEQIGLPILHALKTLDLTEEQKAQVKQILKDTREKINGVLTDEQRKELRERREAGMKAFKEGCKKTQEAPTTKPAQAPEPPKAEE